MNAPESQAGSPETFDFVVVANRLPVDRVVDADGTTQWRTSPGGLVTAMEAVMRVADGAWVGWAGEAGDAPAPFDDDDIHLHPVPLSADEVRDYYEGFCNDTIWPIYHDVIVSATFHREWWRSYRTVNERFARAAAEVAAPGATVWVQDYQLQLVPQLLRDLRPDLRIGWFNHIPFPPVELFAQLPWRRHILRGLLGADFLGFQRADDAANFRRSAARLAGVTLEGEVLTLAEEDGRQVRTAAVPISVDSQQLDRMARTEAVRERAAELRASLGNPRTLVLGIDRLDYTKGIRHRLKAFGELLAEGSVAPPETTFVQIATPSRERVEAYRNLREQVEGTVGHLNGDFSPLGTTAIHYIHRSHPRQDMAALFLAADVMLVTPLRDGMNLVAKEYVACQVDGGGALVLSEFTGAAEELGEAYLCNPHDVEGLKQTLLRAITDDEDEKRRRMAALREVVLDKDVHTWSRDFLLALEHAPDLPPAGEPEPAVIADAEETE
ncbi:MULTISPECIES: alpha,alpha-trehalose-phosphate synthase (UDP-forming) [Kytococcus]|uniref:alpha,alpha-trehalose-phosphate synthase (UDP-forming) n=1 Tax=Kytococcus TaxID=57499 RepID=UPI0008A62615|nr:MULTISPECIES: trehalose-6-phosphate synthase [Kytococcus]OFS05945.1 trehalose-6-phosphate synthase [Kytococcus sp. HMSC28H12]